MDVSLPFLRVLALLFLLSGRCAGVTVSSATPKVERALGQVAILDCSFTVQSSDTGMLDVEWTIDNPDTNQRDTMVISNQGGQVFTQMQSLRGRVTFAGDVAQGNATIRIASLQASDSATYECKVKKAPGIDRQRIELTVLAPPTTPVCTVAGATELGKDVTLSCGSNAGSTPLLYKWERIGGTLPPKATLDAVLGTLLLRNITRDDTGTYRCTAENRAGTDACVVAVAITTSAITAGAIAGIILGLLLLLLLLLLLCCCCCCRRRRRKQRQDEEIMNEIHEDVAAPRSASGSMRSSMVSAMPPDRYTVYSCHPPRYNPLFAGSIRSALGLRPSSRTSNRSSTATAPKSARIYAQGSAKGSARSTSVNTPAAASKRGAGDVGPNVSFGPGPGHAVATADVRLSSISESMGSNGRAGGSRSVLGDPGNSENSRYSGAHKSTAGEGIAVRPGVSPGSSYVGSLRRGQGDPGNGYAVLTRNDAGSSRDFTLV